jgi:hypothetical protein
VSGRTGIAAWKSVAVPRFAIFVNLVVLREALLAHLADGRVMRMSGTDAKFRIP